MKRMSKSVGMHSRATRPGGQHNAVRRAEKAQAKAERTNRRRIHKRNKRAAIKAKLSARAGFEALAESEY